MRDVLRAGRLAAAGRRLSASRPTSRSSSSRCRRTASRPSSSRRTPSRRRCAGPAGSAASSTTTAGAAGALDPRPGAAASSAAGVRIFEGTRVRAAGRARRGPCCGRPAGRVRAERVVVAADGALPGLVPQLAGPRALPPAAHGRHRAAGARLRRQPLVYARWGFEYHQLRARPPGRPGRLLRHRRRGSTPTPRVEEANPGARAARALPARGARRRGGRHPSLGRPGRLLGRPASLRGASCRAATALFVAGGYNGSGNLNGFAPGGSWPSWSLPGAPTTPTSTTPPVRRPRPSARTTCDVGRGSGLRPAPGTLRARAPVTARQVRGPTGSLLPPDDFLDRVVRAQEDVDHLRVELRSRRARRRSCAVSTSSAFRYGWSQRIACHASQTKMIRASSGICSPDSRSG